MWQLEVASQRSHLAIAASYTLAAGCLGPPAAELAAASALHLPSAAASLNAAHAIMAPFLCICVLASASPGLPHSLYSSRRAARPAPHQVPGPPPAHWDRVVAGLQLKPFQMKELARLYHEYLSKVAAARERRVAAVARLTEVGGWMGGWPTFVGVGLLLRMVACAQRMRFVWPLPLVIVLPSPA